MKKSAKPEATDQLVLGTLRRSHAPLSAYDILAKLKPRGIKSPPLVYRALEKLTKAGTAHRVDALGSYVACRCEHDHHHAISLLTVCTQCKRVDEIHDDAVVHTLQSLEKSGIRITPGAVVELPITCAECV